MQDALGAWVQARRAVVEEALRACIAGVQGPAPLPEAMAYSVLAGGKRLRPLFVLAAAEACGGTAEQALDAAVAVELIHTFSLIHDDLPCMDDDDLRRGRPTCHKVYGEATALLAGDALVSLAFEVLARGGMAPALSARLVAELARATGPAGMLGGQILDLAGEGRHLERAALEEMHRLKTGALIVVSVRVGALCAGAEPARLAALDEVAARVGLAFQMADDVLDVVGEEAALGKPVGSDARHHKSTFVTLLGVDGARTEARRLLAEALALLDAHAPTAASLRGLAVACVERDR